MTDRDPPEWAMKEAEILFITAFIMIEDKQSALKVVDVARALAAARAQGWQDAIKAAAQACIDHYADPNWNSMIRMASGGCAGVIRALTDPGPAPTKKSDT